MTGLRRWSLDDSLDYSTNMAEADADRLLRSYKYCPGRTDAYSSVKSQLKKGQQQLIDEADPSFDFTQTLTHKELTFEEQFQVADLVYKLCQIDSSYPEWEQYGFCRYLLDESGKATAGLKLLGGIQNYKQWHKRGFASKKVVMFYLAQPILDQVVVALSRIDSPGDSDSGTQSLVYS